MIKRNNANIVKLKATSQIKKINLDHYEKSWIKIVKINPGLSNQEFEELWKMKPHEKLKMRLLGKIIECPRFTKSYLNSYFFTGLNHEADLVLPKCVEKILKEYAKPINPGLNQSLINWYDADGSIGKHSDDTRQLVENSDIFSFSFGSSRFFYLEPKQKDANSKFYQIELEHNTLVIMGGECQSTHRHHVPKKKKRIDSNEIENFENRRINVTFRCFK